MGFACGFKVKGKGKWKTDSSEVDESKARAKIAQ